jgi:hypothetical protein
LSTKESRVCALLVHRHKSVHHSGAWRVSRVPIWCADTGYDKNFSFRHSRDKCVIKLYLIDFVLDFAVGINPASAQMLDDSNSGDSTMRAWRIGSDCIWRCRGEARRTIKITTEHYKNHITEIKEKQSGKNTQ